VIGMAPGARTFATVNALMLPQYTLFLTDTFVNETPSAEELADIALMAATEVQRFGIPPKVAFVSHSVFGSSPSEAARRIAEDLGFPWQELMRPVRYVASQLADSGHIEAFQDGQPVDIRSARGPIRLRLRRPRI